LIVGGDKTLIGEDDGKVNILLLGMGGPGHDGPLLTDTMIVASFNTDTKEVVLISIPRDFVVLLADQGFRKINSAYAYAELAEPGSGGIVAAAAVEKITGLTIPYYASIDFKGFVKAVDHVGGVDVTIDRTFTDTQYPDEKNWYLEPVTFRAGPELMTGQRALIFARSRHGTNNEGSDFARSERQKKIILAFKDKVAKLNLSDLKTLNNLLNDFTENFRTNLEPYEIKRLAELTSNIQSDSVYSLSLAPQGNLICDGVIGEYENRAYVIQPCEGKTLSDIHEFLSDVVLVAKLKKEEAKIEIQNSTGKAYVLDSWRALQTAGFDITIKSFQSRTPYDRTILYDNSGGQKPKTLEYLQNNFNFTKADIPYSQSTADFVIILGKDAL
ncbi:MAG: LCP family protein, partial [Candidatus Doudnabacteria bacterium]|nr:LCP family protein [Candidatus Doudnabacteria bacterium]